MRITIDTKLKTISVEGSVEMEELISQLEKMFPNGEWKEYKLAERIVYNQITFNDKWIQPSDLVPVPQIPNPYTGKQWWEQPFVTYC